MILPVLRSLEVYIMRDYKYGDLYFDSQHDKQMKIDVAGTGIVIDNSMIEM